MSKYLIVGDIHIQNNKQLSAIKQNENFIEIFNIFDFISETAKNKNVDGIIFMGDIFDIPDKTTTDIMSIFAKLFYNLSLNYQIIMITGNHDMITDNVNIKIGENDFIYTPNTLSQFKYFNNIIVIDKPTIVNVDNTNIDLILVPYSNDIVNDFNSLKLNKNNNQVVFGHFEWFNSYHKLLPNNGENFIKKETMADKYNIKLCVCGHIHDYDDIEYNGSRFIYTGSCRNINFNNTKEKSYLYIFDTDDISSLEKIENPYTYIYKTFDNEVDFNAYIKSKNESETSRTKVKYKYKSSEEINRINKYKYLFKSIKYEKQLDDNIMNINKSNITKEELDNLGSLLQNNLIDENKIIEYSFIFKSPNDDLNKEDLADFIKKVSSGDILND